MTEWQIRLRAMAAEHALRSLRLELDAIRFCKGPTMHLYSEAMRASMLEKIAAQDLLIQLKDEGVSI